MLINCRHSKINGKIWNTFYKNIRLRINIKIFTRINVYIETIWLSKVEFEIGGAHSTPGKGARTVQIRPKNSQMREATAPATPAPA